MGPARSPSSPGGSRPSPTRRFRSCPTPASGRSACSRTRRCCTWRCSSPRSPEGMILKDGSSFNVQWIGARPIFIDIGSFTRLEPGDPWTGYRQFCRHFLFPLLLAAYRDVPFQPWLRGSLEGIGARECRRLMSARDLLRPGVLTQVWLQASAEARYGDGAAGRRSRAEAVRSGEVRAAVRRAGFHAGLIRTNVERLKRLIGGLDCNGEPARGGRTTPRCSHTRSRSERRRRRSSAR